MGGIFFFTSRISQGKTRPRPPINVAVTDLSSEVFAEAKNGSFYNYNKSNPDRQILIRELPAGEDPNAIENEGRNQLQQGGLDVYVVVERGILRGSGGV